MSTGTRVAQGSFDILPLEGPPSSEEQALLARGRRTEALLLAPGLY